MGLISLSPSSSPAPLNVLPPPPPAALPRHASQVVLPAVSGSPPDLVACSSGLVSALRRVEEGTLGVLRRLVDMYVIQVRTWGFLTKP